MVQNFFSTGAEIAVLAKDWSQRSGILICDIGDGAKENREANGEDALFAAREDAAAEVEGGVGGVIGLWGAAIVWGQADLFVLFGSGGGGCGRVAGVEAGGRHGFTGG